MNILFIVPYAPTPLRVRPRNFILALARLGHAITLATVVEGKAEAEALRVFESHGVTVLALPLGLARKGINVLGALFSPEPLQARFSWQPRLAAGLADAAANADVIHIEHLRGARYGLGLKQTLVERCPPIVWDSVDCITHLFEQAKTHRRGLAGRALTAFELPRTRRYEARLTGAFARVLVTSPRDRDALAALAQASISVVTNGVDLVSFATPPPGARCAASVLFSGKMSYHANVAAAVFLAEEVMPLVWARRPEARLLIAGSRPPARVRALAAHDRRVTVTGYVTDMAGLMRSAAVGVAPMLYGAGVQNKVLEAMACGLPVVATPLAIAALERVGPGEECLVGATPAELAAAIVALLDDPGRAADLGRAGRRYAEAHHNWAAIARQLTGIYEEVARGKP